MKIKYIAKKYKIIFALILLHVFTLSGCKSVPSKYGTAMDDMKTGLLEDIDKNKKIAKINLPVTVKRELFSIKSASNLLEMEKINFPKHRFNVVAENVPAKPFFLGLVENTKTNIILHPNVSGTISVNLKNVTISDVLKMVERIYGYGFEVQNNNVKVFPATLQTRAFVVNYIDLNRDGDSLTKVKSSSLESANQNSSRDNDDDNYINENGRAKINSRITTTSISNFWNELKVTLESLIGKEEGRRVAVSPMANRVIVVAMPDELRKVEKYLADSELSLNRQVILEAKVLEVELHDGYRAGINWSLISGRLQASQLGGGNLHSDMKRLPDSTLGSASSSHWGNTDLNLKPNSKSIPTNVIKCPSFGGVLSLGFNYKNFASFVELLNSQGNVQVLSSPRVSTTNNQKALIKIGRDEFYVTDVSVTTTSASATATVPTVTPTFDSFFSGIALDVMPQIDAKGNVILHVHPTISEVTTDLKRLKLSNNATQEYPLARSTIRESDSIVRAKSGEIIVIGGLMQNKTEEVVTGIPGLMNIPFLGSIFRHTRQRSRKTELVILLRPIVIDKNGNHWNKELKKAYDKFDKLDVGFHVGGNTDVFGTEAERR